MTSYFNTPERIELLRRTAAEVEGTPFFANSEAPGVRGGMDCVHLLNYVYRTCGVIGPLSWPSQTMDWGLHNERSLMIEAFQTWPALVESFERLPDIADLQPGDALIFLQGKVPHHSGVLLDGGDMLHTLKARGAHTMRLDAAIRGRAVLGYLAAVFRPINR